MSEGAGSGGPEAGPFDVAALSHVGTDRGNNEDACGFARESETRILVGVADGVSGAQGGETASRLAVEVLLRDFAAQPAALPAEKRLARAMQRANIEVHELSLFVPELAGMATTLTALALDGGALSAAHVGDSRLYLVRGGAISQLTRDHTATAEKVRLGLLSEERARWHPDRSRLTRTVGRELIAALDRISLPVARDDVLVLCSDGLYSVLEDSEIESLTRGRDAASACSALIAAANERGTPDNVTAAVVRVVGDVIVPPRPGLGARLRRLVGGG